MGYIISIFFVAYEENHTKLWSLDLRFKHGAFYLTATVRSLGQGLRWIKSFQLDS